MSASFRKRLIHFPLISFLTENLPDVSAVAGHGSVLAALLLNLISLNASRLYMNKVAGGEFI